jgi:hypothetical protein
MTASRKCVRCGEGPRLDTAYVCGACAADPATRREVEVALRELDPRAHVIARYGWVGGWRIGGEPRLEEVRA